MLNVKEDKLSINGIQMDYIRFGRGKKPLLMIQGLNTRGIRGSGLSLALAYRCFAKDYTVYLFDRRENIEGDITVRELAADTAAAMDALGLSAADVLGVSQGGMIGQYLAIDRPELVSKLVIAVSLARNNVIVEQVIGSFIEMTRQGKIKELVADMAEKLYTEKYLKLLRPLLPLLTVLQKPKDKDRFITLAKSCLSCSAYDELDKIKCPVLVIGAGRDRMVGGDASRELAARLGCELYMYEELGHAAYDEARDFNKRVYDFFMKQNG